MANIAKIARRAKIPKKNIKSIFIQKPTIHSRTHFQIKNIYTMRHKPHKLYRKICFIFITQVKRVSKFIISHIITRFKIYKKNRNREKKTINQVSTFIYKGLLTLIDTKCLKKLIKNSKFSSEWSRI